MVQVYLYSLIVHTCGQEHLLLGNNQIIHSSVVCLSSPGGAISDIAQIDVIKDTVSLLVMRSNALLTKS